MGLDGGLGRDQGYRSVTTDISEQGRESLIVRRMTGTDSLTVAHLGATQAPLTPASLADALFTPVQQRVLGWLFGQPERRFQSGELIRLAKSGTGAVHRLLTKLAQTGLVTVAHVGNQKHYKAKLADKISLAFVYGSVARGAWRRACGQRHRPDGRRRGLGLPGAVRSPANSGGRTGAHHPSEPDVNGRVASQAWRGGQLLIGDDDVD